MAMKTNLLLQQEIKVVRAENERKMKKRARRHAPLGNHALLTVQEGLDRVQQLDVQVEEQAQEQVYILSQRAPPRCSGCRAIGHTIRGCINK
jgi:hypothetical protein